MKFTLSCLSPSTDQAEKSNYGITHELASKQFNTADEPYYNRFILRRSSGLKGNSMENGLNDEDALFTKLTTPSIKHNVHAVTESSALTFSSCSPKINTEPLHVALNTEEQVKTA